MARGEIEEKESGQKDYSAELEFDLGSVLGLVVLHFASFSQTGDYGRKT